jgi:hypothetical protein
MQTKESKLGKFNVENIFSKKKIKKNKWAFVRKKRPSLKAQKTHGNSDTTVRILVGLMMGSLPKGKKKIEAVLN